MFIGILSEVFYVSGAFPSLKPCLTLLYDIDGFGRPKHRSSNGRFRILCCYYGATVSMSVLVTDEMY